MNKNIYFCIMYSQKLSQILSFSKEEADRLGSKSVAPEHLMLAILRDPSTVIARFFEQKSIDTVKLKQQLEQEVSNHADTSAANVDGITAGAQMVIKVSAIESKRLHSDTIEVEHLLLSLLHNYIIGNNTRQVLEANNVTGEEFSRFIEDSQSSSKAEKLEEAPIDSLGFTDEEDEEEEMNERKPFGRTSTTTKNMRKSKTPMLDRFALDLTKKASDGDMDPVIGRDKELERVMEILCRRKKNNPVLIGEPGVGKSAIVEALAQRIANRQTSPILFNKKVYSLDLSAIVAGTKYRGQFEERIHQLIKELEENTDIIVFIDEIHTMIGAGNASGSMDAANILKPALARGVIQCIGATTLDEYRKSIEKDGALERRFQKVLVEPNTKEETLCILMNLKDYYEKYHHVRYTDEAIAACVSLTDRYISDRTFPDKAIDAMDEVGSKVHLSHAETPANMAEKEKEIQEACAKKEAAVAEQNYETAAEWRETEVRLQKELDALRDDWIQGKNTEAMPVTEQDVADVISKMSGVPVKRMVQKETLRLKGIRENLLHDVIAQDSAVETLVRSIRRNRLGLKEPNRPIGVFMFLGPTGVGKTYLAKKLAEYMFGSSDSLIRINMNEYSESFNISRLIGSPPGYVGYEESGELTERVRRHPYSIVLFDEIEKAHGNVFNLLLQVLDEGKITDGSGRDIDFRNTIIIMTSNVGTRQLKDFGRGIGFNAGGLSQGYMLNEADKAYARGVIQKSLEKKFSPEFLNRLDEIITFDQLDKEALKKIVDLELVLLTKRIAEIGYNIDVDAEARDFLAEKGYDIQFGARPLKRALQTYLEDGLSEMIINEDVEKGAQIHVGCSEGKITFGL
ncbi:MAG: ATP-dependent Clp protease ATP-binding subunit [Prevotellaceae bacterium]|nr:ATP-dependent Clp protease ATP-binding subunit [Prevotellaceae bacterium]